MTLLRATSSELTKQFTTAIWWVLAIVLAAYVGLTAAGLAAVIGAAASGVLVGADASASELGSGGTALLYSLANSVGYVFPLLIGALLVTGEFRHKTLTPTFLAIPRRGTVLGGKIIAGAVMGLIYGAVSVVVTVAGVAGLLALFRVDPELDSSDTWAMLGRILIASVLWVLVGIGTGLLVRNQVAAIVIVLAFTQFVEPLLRVGGSFVSQLSEVAKYLPGSAADALVGSSIYTSMSATSGAALEWWAGGLVLAAYAVVLLLAGHIFSWRRDVA
ncbi:MAG: ABC transporter permease [Microbacterium sp.]|uniref:ABC transporter permease n=1 Tax=Microbacterium sp. TaxID=51671 RepID=UPI0039E68052